MIISKNTFPEKDVYYTASLVLGALMDSPEQEVDFFELYNHSKVEYSLSMSSFNLSLIWLFMIGAIDTEQGKIIKCF